MKLKKVLRSLLPLAVMVSAAAGQTPDSTQNGLLKGSYRFRHVAVLAVDSNYNPTEIAATYGTIAFDGAGNYTVTATTVDNIATSGESQPLAATGTYAIGSNGLGALTNPLNESDDNANIYGAVTQGVFVGSSVQSQNDATTLNDIFVAIPVGASPTNASFTAAYQTGLLDFPGADSVSIKNALFELAPDGKGNFATISLNGQEANQGGSGVAQTVSGATYTVNSDGSATLGIPLPTGATNALFAGSKTMFQSADGNFILGWTPGGYDIFFGIKALAAARTNSLSQGLYYTAALEDTPLGLGTDSYYGGTTNSGDAAGDGIVHQRLNVVGALSEDYETDDQVALNADGTTGPNVDCLGYQYIFGDGGQAFVGIGANGFYSLVIGLHAAAFSGSGVYLNPVGINSAASFAPVTASIAPGELLVLTGTGLQSAADASVITAPGGQAFPTALGGVTVTINGITCPIYYVSYSSVAVVVPYEVAASGATLANIQVGYNGIASNVVQVNLTDAEPGAFSQASNGLGYAAAEHALTGQLVTPTNPAQSGEYISLYLTGLGTVTPTVADGAVGSTDPFSLADVYMPGNLAVYFNDFASGSASIAGNLNYAGLAPGLAGLYQINVQVPSTGLVAGDNVYVEFVTDAADVDQIQIPYGSVATGPDAGNKAHIRAKKRYRQRKHY